MNWAQAETIGIEYLEIEFGDLPPEQREQAAKEKAQSTIEYFDPDAERLAERRALRLKNCGKLAPRINAEEKGFKWYPFYCNNYRECPKCRDRRANEMREDIERALYSDSVFYIVTTEEISSEITQDLPKSDYKRFPMGDGKVALFSSDPFPGGEKLDKLSVAYLPWTEIVTTPSGSRISGSLGKYEKENDERIPVKTYHILTNAPTQIETEAAKQAVSAVENRKEKSKEEVQQTIEIMKSVFERVIANLGYVVLLSNTSTQYVNLVRIKEINEIRKKAKIKTQ